MNEIIHQGLIEDNYLKFYDLNIQYISNKVDPILDNPSSSHIIIFASYLPNGYRFSDSSTYKYNEDGQLIFREYHLFRNGDWDPLIRTNLVYNDNSDLILQKSKSFENGEWKYSIKQIFEFNDEGNITGESFNRFNHEENEWRVSSFSTYAYDVDGNLVRSLRQTRWGDSFIDDRETIRDYNSQNKLVEKHLIDRMRGEFRHFYEYDPNGNLSELKIQKLDDEEWRLIIKISIAYDKTINEPVEIVFQSIDNKGGLVPDKKYTMEYESNGELNSIFWKTWSNDLEKFVPTEKHTYLLDEYKNIFRNEISYYNTNTEGYIMFAVNEFEFLEDGKVGYYRFEDNNYPNFKVKYFYEDSDFASNTNEAETIFFNIYPNPTRNSLQTSWSGFSPEIISLVDNKGKLVQKFTILPGSETATLNLKNLSPGIYFISLSNKYGELATERLVVF
jgi:hypothetical protein